MSISRSANLYFAYKFLRILVSDWDKLDAYKLGIIDERGRSLKKARQLRTAEERNAYTVFDRLAFNIKRVVEKLPFGKTKLASWASALYLIKEAVTEEEYNYIMENMSKEFKQSAPLNEWFVGDDLVLAPGEYKLLETVVSPMNGEEIALKGTSVFVEKNCEPVSTIGNQAIYMVKHIKTNSNIYIASGLLER